MPLISMITCSLCCHFVVSQMKLPIFFRNYSLKWHMKATSIHAPFKIKCSWALEIWYWRNFQTHHVLVQYVMFFYNSIVTRFCGPDVSLCFNVFDSSISFSPSVFKKDSSDYKNKVKIIVNMPGHLLDLYCVRLLKAAVFCQNYAKLFFDAKHLERCPKFLECSLHVLICSKKSYICKWTEMTCWKVEVLNEPLYIFTVAIVIEVWTFDWLKINKEKQILLILVISQWICHSYNNNLVCQGEWTVIIP